MRVNLTGTDGSTKMGNACESLKVESAYNSTYIPDKGSTGGYAQLFATPIIIPNKLSLGVVWCVSYQWASPLLPLYYIPQVHRFRSRPAPYGLNEVSRFVVTSGCDTAYRRNTCSTKLSTSTVLPSQKARGAMFRISAKRSSVRLSHTCAYRVNVSCVYIDCCITPSRVAERARMS